jgi:hypothetical protein
MTTPISTKIRECIPAMWDTMIDLSFVWIRLGCWLSNAFCDNFLVATLMTSEFTVGALHSGCVFKKLTTKSTTHNIVELLLDELVSVLLMDLFFLLTNSTLTS